MESSIELEIARVWMDHERIVHVEFHETDEHSLHEASEVVTAHNRLAGDEPCCVLADLRRVKVGADRSARQHYVSDEGARLKLAMAMVTESPLQRMLGNVFNLMSKPPYPVRMFATEASALEWLRSRR